MAEGVKILNLSISQYSHSNTVCCLKDLFKRLETNFKNLKSCNPWYDNQYLHKKSQFTIYQQTKKTS